MKKLFLAGLFFCYLISVNAQLSEGGVPYSFGQRQLKSTIALPEYHLQHLDKESLFKEDSIYPAPLRYALLEEVDIDLKNGANTRLTTENGEIWRYRMESEEGLSIQIIFKKFFIPPGAKLFLYNESCTQIAGAFTSANNRDDSTFTIADFKGSHVILEYYEPFEVPFKGILIIGTIGQAYRDIFSSEAEKSNTDYININCIEGKDWQNEKHAVCKITFNIGMQSYLCTGALLNNAKQDGTPYFLTASHCISTNIMAQTVVAYFNYETEGCNGNLNAYKTLSGATLLTTGSKSDYTLLKFVNTPPQTYSPYYAGWDISNSVSTTSTGIHHPEGLEKKVSIEFDKTISYDAPISWDEGGGTSPPDSHWEVDFNLGKTAGGSSGSPLFSDKKLVIGQLHGGDSISDYYGKFSYSWTNNNSGYNKLQKYLDPDNTGIKILEGYAPESNYPDAYFYLQSSSVCLSAPVNFYNKSTFNPTRWDWKISPATFTFLDGTTSSTENPVIQFEQEGQYSIKLIVDNPNGKDSMEISNAISAGSALQLDISTLPGIELCYCDFDSLKLTASGANEYVWDVSKQEINPFYFSNINKELAVIKYNSAINFDSTYYLTVKLKGTQGTCADSTQQTIEIVKQANDNIVNAIPIAFGNNGPYSNACAGIEEGEPVPSHASCTGQNSWCDEYGTGQNIVENSVWFRFKAPPGGKVGLSSQGFDSEIAIYESDSYEAILSGQYTIVAANDDESILNPFPEINKATVVPEKVYWVQVDGSGGGSEGTFILKLTDLNPTGILSSDFDNSIKIYPQPANTYARIESDSFVSASKISYEVYSLTGIKICSNQLSGLSDNSFTLNLSDWNSGMYILKMNIDNILTYSQIIKQ